MLPAGPCRTQQGCLGSTVSTGSLHRDNLCKDLDNICKDLHRMFSKDNRVITGTTLDQGESKTAANIIIKTGRRILAFFKHLTRPTRR